MREALNALRGDAVDLSNDIVDGEEAAEVHLLAGEIVHTGGGAFEAEDDVGLHLVLSALEFGLGDGFVLETAEFGEGEFEDALRFVEAHAGVDHKGAGVAEGVELGVDGVGEALVFADGLEEAGAHAAAEDGIEEIGGEALRVGDRRGRDAEAHLDLLERTFFAERDVGGGDGMSFRVGGRVRAGLERTEFLLDKGYEFVVVEVAGSGEDHVLRGKAALMVAEDGIASEAGDSFGGAEDRTSDGMILPEFSGECFVDEVVGVVLVHLNFFQDDALLALKVGLREVGVKNEVGEDVEGLGGVLVQYLDVEADGLFAGEGVEITADGVDLAGDVLGGAAGGSFEDHVLDEVGEAVFFDWLVTGAGVDPGTHGYGAHMRHGLGEDEEAIGEDGAADVAGLVNAGGGLSRRVKRDGLGHGTPWDLGGAPSPHVWRKLFILLHLDQAVRAKSSF